MRLAAIFTTAALAMFALSAPALADPASPSPDAAERLQLAHQILELSGGEKAVDRRVESMFATASKLVAANTSPDAARLEIAMQRDMQDEMLKLVPSIVGLSVQAYADNLTTQELRDYVAFLSSDSGKSIISKGPAIQQEALDRAIPLMAQMLPALERKVSDRVCEEVHCTAAERKIVAEAMSKAFPGRS